MANGVREGDAHEALSDVRALIGLARLLRERAAAAVGLRAASCATSASPRACSIPPRCTPVLHVSQRYPGQPPVRGAGAAAGAASAHRQPRDRVRPRRAIPSAAGAGARRDRRPPVHAGGRPARGRGSASPLKEVHLNRCPALVAWSHLREADFARLQHRPGARANATPAACATPGRPWRRRCARCSRSERAARRRRRRRRAVRRLPRPTATSACSAEVRTTPPEPLGSRDVRLPRCAPARAAVPLPRAQLAGRPVARRARALGRLPPPSPARPMPGCRSTPSSGFDAELAALRASARRR